ncbi:MAG: hypothetical protein IPG17_00365 [Sandaracinaceae bacterium]|jgi:hypothetical protein|nr:hypothetical protein [Sandaracinaceae bacterium]MBK7773273.1 hypothetical protein [Sandaracinaceae bacterium]
MDPKAPPSRRDRLLAVAPYVVIAGLTAVFIVPIWTAVFPPMTDFGAQLIMADVWARYDELPNAATNFVLHTEWSAQRAPARLAAWLYPTVTPLITLKIYLSVALALCSLGLCLVARAFDRSPWLVVLCLPGLWGGMMALGVLHYVFSYGFILASAAFGRWAAVREDRWPLLGILLANLGACMVHGVGFVFAMLFGAVAFVASAPRLRQWVAVLAFLPPLAIWLSWTTEHTGQGEMFSGGLLTVVQEHATWASATGRITWFIHQGHDILTDGTDTYLALVLGALWLVLMATAAPSEPVSAGAPLRERVREHALLTLVIVVGVTAFLLPSNIKNTEINSRLITPFLFLVALLPRVKVLSRTGAGVLVCAVLAVLAYGVHLREEVARFQAEELDPLMELLEQVPMGSRVDCLRVCEHSVAPHFVRRPVCSACNGLVQTQRDGFSGGGFAMYSVNPIGYAPGRGYPTVRTARWWMHSNLRSWDYVIIRNGGAPPPSPTVSRIAHVDPRAEGAGAWSLYEVRTPE